jgi:phage terminase large subunit-like protein
MPRVELREKAILVTNQAKGSAKIAYLMAAFNAIALMSTNPWSTRPGLFFI